MQFETIQPTQSPLRMLLCGESGAGKTHLARTLKPETTAVLVSEPKYLPLADSGLPILRVETWSEFMGFLDGFASDDCLYNGTQRVRNLFVDSLSELAQLLYTDLISNQRPTLTANRDKADKQSGQGSGQRLQMNYEDAMTIEDYGAFQRQFNNALRRLFDKNVHIFCTVRMSLLTKKDKKGNESTYWTIDLPGKTRHTIGQYFDLVGFVRRDRKDPEGRARVIDFSAEETIMAKESEKLPKIIPGNLLEMQKALLAASKPPEKPGTTDSKGEA